MDRDIKEIMVGMHWSCYVYDLPFMIFIFFLFPIPRFPSSDIARSSKVAVWIMITSAASNRAVVCWPKKRYCTFPLHFSFPLTSHLLTLAQSLTLALFHTHTHTHTHTFSLSLSLALLLFCLTHPTLSPAQVRSPTPIWELQKQRLKSPKDSVTVPWPTSSSLMFVNHNAFDLFYIPIHLCECLRAPLLCLTFYSSRTFTAPPSAGRASRSAGRFCASLSELYTDNSRHPWESQCCSAREVRRVNIDYESMCLFEDFITNQKMIRGDTDYFLSLSLSLSLLSPFLSPSLSFFLFLSFSLSPYSNSCISQDGWSCRSSKAWKTRLAQRWVVKECQLGNKSRVAFSFLWSFGIFPFTLSNLNFAPSPMYRITVQYDDDEDYDEEGEWPLLYGHFPFFIA